MRRLIRRARRWRRARAGGRGVREQQQAAAAAPSSGASATSRPRGKPGTGKPAVTLGDKNFTEQFVLGQLYKQALEAKGYTVNLKANIGARS